MLYLKIYVVSCILSNLIGFRAVGDDAFYLFDRKFVTTVASFIPIINTILAITGLLGLCFIKKDANNQQQ